MDVNPLLSKLKVSFFDNSNDPFCLFDSKLHFVYINKAYERVYNLTFAEVYKKKMTDVFPSAKESGRDLKYLEALETGVPFTADALTNHPNSGLVYNRVSAFKVDDYLGVCLFRITDLKTLIENLDRFVYKASHDMKSPMNSILGLVNLAKDANETDMREYLSMIEKATQRINDLLGKLIDTAKIGKTNISLNKIDLRSTIEEIIKSLSFTEGFKSMKVNLKVDVKEKEYHTDELLFTFIMQNIIDNAIKYRNKNQKQPYVYVTLTESEQDLKIIIEDNGIGIPEEQHEKVFSMFFRADSRIPGSGLGLYSVIDGVKKLKGKIEFVSKQNVGTTFTITLPLLG